MRTIQTKRSRLIRLFVPAISIAVLAYFAAEAQTGDYGLTSKVELERRLNVSTAQLNSLQREHAALKQRIQLLSDGTLERDMLDERARWGLNVVSDDEIVILR